MKITTERRIRRAESRVRREQAKLDMLRWAAAREDATEDRPPPPLPERALGWPEKTDMVGDVIEALFPRMFQKELAVPMIVEEDRSHAFTARCLKTPLPNGCTQMVFLKSMKYRSWR